MNMKIITWNCCGGFRGKSERIAKLKPDIAAIQEAEPIKDISSLSGKPATYWHRNTLRPLRKSIGMVSYTSIKLAPIDIMPGVRRYEAQQGSQVFHVLAVWTSVATRPRMDYHQLHDALSTPDAAALIRQRPTVVLGDFNLDPSSKGWKALMELTESLKLVSAYHRFFKEDFGEETRHTHFHHGKEDNTFHIDYCFVPEEWTPRIDRVEVGSYADWGRVSDHAPLIVDLKFP